MAKGFLAQHNVSFEVDSIENLSESVIKEQNPHLTDGQVSEVLEILTDIREAQNEEHPTEDY